MPRPRFRSILYGIEDALCILSLVLLALLPAVEVVARLLSRTLYGVMINFHITPLNIIAAGIPGSSGLMIHLLLVAGLLAGMITTRNKDHLAIALVQHFSNDAVKNRIQVLTNLLSALIVTVIAWTGASFIRLGLQGRMIGFIPDRVFALIIPVGYGVIAIRFARRTGLTGWKKFFPALAIILGTFLSFPVIAKFIWGLDLPDTIFTICDTLSLAAYYLKIPVVVILLSAALAGTPLFVVMGGIALFLLEAAGGEMDSVASDIYSALTNSNIIAIPLFTLVGFFLSESKAGERLVTAFRSLFSWLPGGMIIAAVIICAFFTSFTGASGVTILALGGILYTILSEHVKYPENFSIGLLTSVGSIGLLFPPSLPIILVGATTQTNIFHLFLGGIVPGLILVAAVIIFGIIASVRIKIPVEKFELKKAALSLKESVFEILLPIFLILGYFTGTLSLVEIGAAGAIYIFIVEVLIHKDIKFADIPKVFAKAVPIIGGVLSILALSKALSYYIVDTQAPANLAKWMQGTIESKYLFLLLLNLTLLVVGCLMDIFSAILIVLPLIAPLSLAYGIDPVHLGIIFITNLEVGFLTPPVGLNLFLASYRFKKSFVDICRYVFPFLLIQLAVVLLVTYLPVLSTYLTRFF
jgi:tripartite ATP-independent transporter DctM subunit